jgi:type VI protein secretion system component VasK
MRASDNGPVEDQTPANQTKSDGPPTSRFAARSSDAVTAVRAFLEKKMKQAIAEIEQAPALADSPSPRYALPWFLFMGDEDAGVDGLLKTVVKAPRVPPVRGGSSDFNWHWWPLDTMIAIELSPSLVVDKNQDPTAWHLYEQAIAMVHRERRKLALNGVVVVVAASAMLAGREQLVERGRVFRDHLDEIYATMKLICPIYLVITGLNQLPGHDGMFGALPPEVGRQALGYRIDPPELVPRIAQRLPTIFDDVWKRLEALRLGILEETVEDSARGQSALSSRRRQVYDFIEAFRDLGRGLEASGNAMLSDDRFRHALLWRGLYFTAPQSPMSHAEDLFERFLPADQSVARVR